MVQMLKELNDNELAKLHAKFVVPVAVDQMLHAQEALDDVAEYTMHDIIGSLQPDTALLCIAMCAQHVSAHCGHLLIAHALRAEADMVVNEYGPLWLANEAGAQNLREEEIIRLLRHIPEDLEALGDLLEATCAELDENAPIPAILCDILMTQARAHMEFAELELATLGLLPLEKEDVPAGAAAPPATSPSAPAANNDRPLGPNVLRFPSKPLCR